MATPKLKPLALIFSCCFAFLLYEDSRASDDHIYAYRDIFPTVESKIVKIYGAGGIRGLEAYQTGICISPDGYLLTVWSYVLDTDDVVAVFTDGRRVQAELVGADPITEVAVLKCDLDGEPVDYFDLHQQPTLGYVGQPILALSNLFGIATGNESVSVVHGVISSIAPLLARRGAFNIRYRGEVYIVDAAANNPGAAGGALVDARGRLLGILGKEVRSQLTNTWLNFAIPVQAFSAITENIIAGSYEPPLSRIPAKLPECPRLGAGMPQPGHRAALHRR